MRLVKAGGVYVPASSVIAAKHSDDDIGAPKRFCNGIFTARQAAVVEALRRGKANKIIAYELLHDAANMHLHSAFEHLKFIRDDFVRLASPQCLNDCRLARCEHAVAETLRGSDVIVGMFGSDHTARRDIDASRFHEAHGFDRNLKR